MKKFLKKIAIKNTEKAFTAMSHFQPKMPKILMDKIKEDKTK